MKMCFKTNKDLIRTRHNESSSRNGFLKLFLVIFVAAWLYSRQIYEKVSQTLHRSYLLYYYFYGFQQVTCRGPVHIFTTININNNNNTQICTRVFNESIKQLRDYKLQSIDSLNNKSIAESKARKVAWVLRKSKIKCFQITFERCKSWGKPNRQREWVPYGWCTNTESTLTNACIINTNYVVPTYVLNIELHYRATLSLVLPVPVNNVFLIFVYYAIQFKNHLYRPPLSNIHYGRARTVLYLLRKSGKVCFFE